MKLQDVYNLLSEKKKEGVVLDYRPVKDTGNKVVLNITFARGDVAYQRNYTLLVKDRGLESERVYWLNGKPVELFPTTASALGQKVQESLDDITGQISGFIKLEGYTVNDRQGFAMLTAFVDNGDGTVSRKQFLVYFDAQGNPVVREIR